MPSKSHFTFDNSYARDLPGFYVEGKPTAAPRPKLLFVNSPLLDELGLDLLASDTAVQAEVFSGNRIPEGAVPIAQAYAGHQFGNFSPQLGDGRALLLGEVIDRHGQRRDIAFKGSGRTPFSRGGDGKAAVGPMLREVLIGEAMHALGIPTTRALAVVATGESVYRDKALPGAVLTRVAASHIRVGTFEYFAAQGDTDKVRQLADYTLARHYPDLAGSPAPYLDLLRAVTQRQAALLAQWMAVGFIHGVMNTDNMSIAGETIDYGPCAFMDAYNPETVFSSIDTHGRYAYRNQPRIAQWNLARFAETLLPLLATDAQEAIDLATATIASFHGAYRVHWLDRMRAKLGLIGRVADDHRLDTDLAEDWLGLLQASSADFTLAWRYLADAAEGNRAALQTLIPLPALDAWLQRWQARCSAEDAAAHAATETPPGQARADQMRAVNPAMIPRNHRVEEALRAASDDGDLVPFNTLLLLLKQPFAPAHAAPGFADPAPADFTAGYRTFCGT